MKNIWFWALLFFWGIGSFFFPLRGAWAGSALFLPPNAINVKTSDVRQPGIRIFDQSGLLPYNGRCCFDVGTLWWTVDGKEVHDNEYFEVGLGFLQFDGESGKLMMDQYRRNSPVDGLVEEFRDKMRKPQKGQFEPVLLDVLGGKLMVWQEKIGCAQAQYSSYVRTNFKGVSMTQWTVLSISGSYNSSDGSIALSVYNQIASSVE